jgi:nucleotide-binding universal stress UspA family protein
MPVKPAACGDLDDRAYSKRRNPMKILLPVDGSDYTKRMLAHLAAHDELLGPGHEYIAFVAIPPIPSHASRFLDHAALNEWYAERAEEVLKPVRAFAEQQHWNLRTAHRCGHPAEAITNVATEEKVDLIVMGTHGHSALRNIVLGSVATGVLARCKLPVLLLR